MEGRRGFSLIDGLDAPLTRRRLIKLGAGAGLALGAGGLLAACGDDSKSSGGGAKRRSGGPTGGVGEQLVDLLGLPTGRAAGAGLTIPMGASLILSGPYETFGRDHLRGLQLAVRHIKAAGGPDIKLNVRDNGVTLAKGVANVREFAATKCPAQFSDGSATLGAELPGYRQFKIFALDPGGSIGAYAGSPFYYMVRPVSPDQYLGAWTNYMRQAHPEARRWALLATDAGADYNRTEIANTTRAAEANDFEFVGEVHVPFDTTDFAPAFAKLKATKPDVIQTALYGDQLGVALKQLASSGIEAKAVGPDFTDGAARVAGSALQGFTFGNDWFDAENPTNDWARLFVEEYKAANGGALPGYHAAEYYQTAFFMWQVVRQVIADGGDPTETGTDNYVKAVEAIPSFQSIYGGKGSTVGSFEFDLESHIPKVASCMICEVSAGEYPTPKATFNVGDTTVEMI